MNEKRAPISAKSGTFGERLRDTALLLTPVLFLLPIIVGWYMPTAEGGFAVLIGGELALLLIRPYRRWMAYIALQAAFTIAISGAAMASAWWLGFHEFEQMRWAAIIVSVLCGPLLWRALALVVRRREKIAPRQHAH